MEPLGNRNIREGYGVCGHADGRGQLGAGRGCPRVTGRLSQRVLLASGAWGEKAAGQRSPSLVSDISCPGVLFYLMGKTRHGGRGKNGLFSRKTRPAV